MKFPELERYYNRVQISEAIREIHKRSSIRSGFLGAIVANFFAVLVVRFLLCGSVFQFLALGAFVGLGVRFGGKGYDVRFRLLGCTMYAVCVAYLLVLDICSVEISPTSISMMAVGLVVSVALSSSRMSQDSVFCELRKD